MGAKLTETEFFAVRENEGKPRKCSFDAGKLTMCWPMEQAVEFPYGQGSRKQGLKFHSMSNIKTMEFSRHAIHVVSGDWNKQGVELTFCPFCASVLNPYYAEEITVSVSEVRALSEEQR